MTNKDKQDTHDETVNKNTNMQKQKKTRQQTTNMTKHDKTDKQ